MIRRSLSCDAFFFPLFVFVQPAEAYFREIKTLILKETDKKQVLPYRQVLRLVHQSRLFREKRAKPLFHTIYRN